uniref:Immunoglobulin V-set domain-containing protein n=1 Tax=Sparus aurata TaxID=8175 RepID=A0A671U012_SPAAU
MLQTTNMNNTHFAALGSMNSVSCEELSPVKNEESSLEDSTVNLSYTYSKQAAGSDCFFWYRQYPGKPPEFLISHLGTQNDTNNRLSVIVGDDKTRMYLQISSAAVTDSAVYYCAVRPTVTGNTKTLYKNLWESHTVKFQQDSQSQITSVELVSSLCEIIARHDSLLHVEVSLSKILNPKLLLMAPCMAVYECVCVNVARVVQCFELSLDWNSAIKMQAIYQKNADHFRVEGRVSVTERKENTNTKQFRKKSYYLS